MSRLNGFTELTPDCCVERNNEVDNREHEENDQADDRPFLQLGFQGFSLVFTEEGFGRTTQRVDTRRVALLQQNQDNCTQSGDSHNDNRDDCNDIANRKCGIRC